jgi:hypothetical protein
LDWFQNEKIKIINTYYPNSSLEELKKKTRNLSQVR